MRAGLTPRTCSIGWASTRGCDADLGCGGGDVTFEIARQVGPGGNVTGIDMDEVKLALARESGLKNVEFRAANVNDRSAADP